MKAASRDWKDRKRKGQNEETSAWLERPKEEQMEAKTLAKALAIGNLA